MSNLSTLRFNNAQKPSLKIKDIARSSISQLLPNELRPLEDSQVIPNALLNAKTISQDSDGT